jgi:hypothetical protein
MRRGALAVFVVVLVGSAWSCAKPEWVIPKSGESACMCKAVCECQGMSPSEESQAERKRCSDACGCEPCPSAGK